ncbi:MAG: hypothetical protein K2Z81_22745 [Cyanobacteria bacterium]|nr:hypothetical protein [Cyanobacteriota bacterium]
MGLTSLFIGLVVGPLVGFLCGMWGIDTHKGNESKAKLMAGVTGWFFGAIAGAIVSGVTANMVTGEPAFAVSFFGISVYGVILGAWVASILGAAAGVVSAKILN